MAQPLLKRVNRRIQKIMAHKSKELVQGWRGLSQGTRPGMHVFVVGAQRSGTNMMMNILDRSYDTKVYHEHDNTGFDQYLMREPEVIQGLVDRARAPVFVIKALCEMHQLPWLMQRFSPAKVIWVVRHFDDAVNSSLRSFTTVASQITKLVEDPEAHLWMGKGMSSETHGQVKKLYYPGINDPSLIALFWYTRNRLYFDLALGNDKRVRLINYERLVTDPHSEFKKTFEFLGLEYRNTLTRNVTPRSVGKARAPDIDPHVRSACEGLLAELHAISEKSQESFQDAPAAV